MTTIALVTGGNRGIGREVCRQLAERGHAVLLTARSADAVTRAARAVMVQEFLPLLRASGHGRIVNVSSEAASLASMGSGTPAYTASKVALNALTRMLAAELRGDRILVNAVCPGWVATDMGGPGGRPVAAGAASVVWAATLPDSGPTGGFFRDGQPLPW
jgi:NAD(P)-dependent dehydrogenase (short-subunit alcohol dehydrogenase family)